jgi:hypothetical protein
MRILLALIVTATLAGCYRSPRDEMARPRPALSSAPARPAVTDTIDLGEDGRVHVITIRGDLEVTRCLVHSAGGVTCLQPELVLDVP